MRAVMATFIVQATNDIVDVVREEASVVENCGQHSRNGTRRHLYAVFMLVHLMTHIQTTSACALGRYP